MSENTDEKKVIEHVAPVREFDNTRTVVTRIGYERGSSIRYEIVFDVPRTDDEAKTRYDCTLAELVAMGVKQITTRPDYKTVGFDADGNLKPNGHNEMQKLADGYKVGARVSGGPTQKAKVAGYNEIQDASGGMSTEEIKALVAKEAARRAKGKK